MKFVPETQKCKADIKGVKVPRLEVESEGAPRATHAIRFEPSLE